jgi:spore coat polysaccharide biosynthesis protein SpsF (cytidylyltransferase family)
MNIGIIVTARVKSSRIQEKVLQQIGSKRAIEILLDNIANSKYDVILAIPENSDDDILEEIGNEKGVLVYRGQDDSPLHRLYECAKQYNYDYIVRITADDILIDLRLLFDQIKFAISKSNDYVYMSRCVEGVAGEVIKFTALEQVAQEITDPVEFVSYYLKKNEFKIKEFYPSYECQHTFRCVMDYPEDLLFLRVLFTCLPEPIRSLDIIHFLRNHKFLLRINQLPEITVYTCNYNTAQFIPDAIESVKNQSFQNFEYLLLDDCSTDNSMNVITEYYSKLPLEFQQKTRILRNDKNLGLPASSNYCLASARGRYIVRLDSDDTFEPDFLQIMLEKLKLSDADGVISGYHETNVKLDKVKKILSNKWHPACAVFSKRVCNNIKYMNNVQFGEGESFYKKFREKHHMDFVKKPLWNYRQHPGQKTKHPEHPKNVKSGSK